MPERFRHRMRVRFNECDPQGVVFYANYLMYFDVAMTEFWREAVGGYTAMIEIGHRRDGGRGDSSATATRPASTTRST